MAILRKPLSLHRGLRFATLLIGILVVFQPIVPAQRPGGGIAAHLAGLVIGGGADGIHKIVKVFTSSFDRVVAANEGEDRRKQEPALVPPPQRSA